MKRIDRIEILQKELKKSGLTAAFLTSGANRRYLTYAGIGSGCLLVTADDAVFFTDSRYIDLAREKINGCEVICAEKIMEAAINMILQRGIKSCGLEHRVISISEYQKLKEMLAGVELRLEDGVDNILTDMRRIKDDYEISCLKQAQKIGDDAYLHILEFIRPGMTESEVRMELGTYMVKLGSENFNMSFITSTGKKTAYPHGGCGDDQILKGNFVMMDFGGMIDGYSADMTRTVAIGYADEQMHRVYDTVKNAQELGLSMMKPGITGQEVHMAVLDYIEQCGYPGCFTHGLGHSLGLEIHENPRCNAWGTSILKAGEMMTIEPGIYLKGKYGVRIEDMGVLTTDGFDNFTTSIKELVIIGD